MSEGRNFLDKFPDAPVEVVAFHHEHATGLVFKWMLKGVGFGEVTMGIRKDSGTFFCDRECMSPEFCADIVKRAIEPAEDPSR